MSTVTQNMRYLQSLIKYSYNHGVGAAARRFNRARSFIYFWRKRYDGTIDSLAKKSTRPHSHPNAHTEQELALIRNVCRRNPNTGMIELWFHLQSKGYTRSIGGLHRVLRRTGWFPPPPLKKKYVPKPYQQMTYPGERVQIDVKIVPAACKVGDAKHQRLVQYTAIDEFTRLRYLAAYQEQSTYSSADFLLRAYSYFQLKGFTVECVQTDNGFEFTNRFNNSKRDSNTLFEQTAKDLGVRSKYIRPYTPRHNGKVERSHREDQKRFYSSRSFYSFDDFDKQLKYYLTRSNNIPMRPLGYLSPNAFLDNLTVQYV